MIILLKKGTFQGDDTSHVQAEKLFWVVGDKDIH